MIDFLFTCTLIIAIFLLGYFYRRALEISNSLPIFKCLKGGPITGGILDGRYVVIGLDNNIHYARPPFILTLEE